MGSPKPPKLKKNLSFLVVNTGSILIVPRHSLPPSLEKFSADALVGGCSIYHENDKVKQAIPGGVEILVDING